MNFDRAVLKRGCERFGNVLRLLRCMLVILSLNNIGSDKRNKTNIGQNLCQNFNIYKLLLFHIKTQTDEV